MEKSKIDRIREIRKGKSNAKPSVSEEIRKYFMSNLLSVIWSASLLGGGLIFWFYFFQIQYFPDLTFDESVLSLILAAITGIFFLWLMATLLMTPYFFRWIVLKAYDYDLGLNGKDRQKSGLGELIWYFFSMFLGTLTLFLIVLKGDKSGFDESAILSWLIKYFECLLWGSILSLFFGHLKYYLDFKKVDKVKETKNEETKGQDNLGILLAPWVFSVLTSVVPLIVLIAIEGQAEGFGDTEPIVLLAIFYLIVMITNYIYAYYREQTEKRKWWVYSIPLLALLAIFCWVKDPIIPKLVMKKFQLGGFTADRLLLDEGGCKILRSMALNPKPKFVKDENDKDLKECYLENVKVLSRLGRVFLLEQELECDKDRTKKFNIPKEHVLSWSKIKSKSKLNKENESETGGDADSNQAKIGTKKKTETCPKDGEAGAS